MGDRSQIAIKSNEKARIYLYSHWGGNEIYPMLQKVIGQGQRLDDPEYLARIIFREMGAGHPGETGFGIGTSAHGDIEHVIPVLDCENQQITFEDAEWEHNKNPEARDLVLTFSQFAAKPATFFKDW